MRIGAAPLRVTLGLLLSAGLLQPLAGWSQQNPPPAPPPPLPTAAPEEAAPPPPERPREQPAPPRRAVLKISADWDCELLIDGKETAILKRNEVEELSLELGNYLLLAKPLGSLEGIDIEGVSSAPTWSGELKAADVGEFVERIELEEDVAEWIEEEKDKRRLGRFDVRSSIIVDTGNQLMWTKNVGPKMRWEQAPGYCRGLALEGLTGWRLPTLEELSTLAWPDHPEPRQEKCEGEPIRRLFGKDRVEMEVMPRMVFEPFDHNSLCSLWIDSGEDRASCSLLSEFNCGFEKRKKQESNVFCVRAADE